MKAQKLIMAIGASLLAFSALSQDSEFKLEETYKIDPKGTLELYSDDANVDIIGSDRKDVHVYIYRKEIVRGLRVGADRDFEVYVDERDGDLIIRERESSGHSFMTVGVQMEDYEISIEVPRGINLELRGDDDDYVIEDVDGSITLEVDDGDATESRRESSLW